MLVTCMEYLKRLAARIRAIARTCFDLETAGQLRQLSDEVESKAREGRRTKHGDDGDQP